MSEHKNDADIQQMDTYTLESMLANVRNLEEYEAIMQQARSQNEIWKEEITALMMETDLTRDRFAKLVAEGCNVGRATAYSLASKAPAKRENVLGIAVLTGRTIDQTNEMLREWAGFSGLYARNADDMIWYYLVMHGANPHPYALFQAYHAVYQKLFQAYQSKPEPERRPDEGRADAAFARLKTPPVKTILAENILEEAAAEYALTVEGAADDAVFADIVDRLLPLMQGAYERLFARLETLCDCKPDQALFWDSERFLGTYRRCMERFCREQVLPKRSFLIALGIHLGLTVRGINDLLELANMGELNPKDKLECGVIFSIEAAYSRYPYVFHPDVKGEEDWLFGGGAQTAAAQLSMPGLGDYSESLNEYIKRRLEEDGLQTDRLSAKEVERFLQYL